MRLIASLLAAGLVIAGAAMAQPPVPPAPTPGDAAGQPAWETAQKAYLTWMASEKGWQKTKSGVYARRTSDPGSGRRPNAQSEVTIHYEGKMLDGTVFDTSFRGMARSFPLPELIKGWQEAVPLMRKDETWELVIPSELGYRDEWHRLIPPNSVLKFRIQLIDFQ